MSEANPTSRSKRKSKKKRTVVRRIVDEHGNVIVRRYKRRKEASALGKFIKSVDALHGPRLITTFLGTILLSAGIFSLEVVLGNLDAAPIADLLSLTEGLLLKTILWGVTGVGIFLGYSFIIYGLKIKKYPSAFNQLISIMFLAMLIASVMSPLTNQADRFRQISDDDYEDWDPDVDLSALSSPFYSELLDGLLSLLDGIDPNIADDILLNMTIDDGFGLDVNRDQYLIRWQSQEKWDPAQNNFVNDDVSTLFDLIDYSTSDLGALDPGDTGVRKFSSSMAYFSVGSSYTGQFLGTWNSEYGVTLNTQGLDVLSQGSSIKSNVETYVGVNEDPNVVAGLQSPASQGAITYDMYWKGDDKASIIGSTTKVSELNTLIPSLKNQYSFRIPAEKFDTITSGSETYTGVDATWGFHSLPSDYLTSSTATFFETKRQEFLTALGGDNRTIIGTATLVTNFILQNIIEGLNAGSLSFDVTQPQDDNAGGVDAGHYFYQALSQNLPWGFKEILPGYINMLRALGVPARLVTGLAGGDYADLDNDGTDDTIQFSLNNLHFWAEILVPWTDSNGNTKLSWAIFNPLPITSELDEGRIVYGRNAISTQANITVSIDSGEKIGPANIQYMGQDFDISAEVIQGDIPAASQTVDVRLVPEAEYSSLTSGSSSIATDVGVSIGNYTTDSNGKLQVSGQVSVNGTLTVPGQDLNVTVSQVNANILQNASPDSFAGTGIYGIVIIFGLSFGGNVTGWIQDGSLVLAADNLNTITHPFTTVTETLYGTTAFSNIQISATLYQSDNTTAISNQPVSVYMYSSTTYQTLDPANPNFGTIKDESLITLVYQGSGSVNPQTTDGSGKATWTLLFDDPFGTQVPAVNKTYYLLAVWDDTVILSNAIALFLTVQTNMTAEGSFPGSQIIKFNELGGTWDINVSVSSYDFVQSSYFPLENVSVILYLVDAQDYVNQEPFTGYTDFKSKIITGFTEGQNLYNISSGVYSNTTTTGSFLTNANGLANFQIQVNGTDFAVAYYYILVDIPSLSMFQLVNNTASGQRYVFLRTDSSQIQSSPEPNNPVKVIGRRSE